MVTDLRCCQLVLPLGRIAAQWNDHRLIENLHQMPKKKASVLATVPQSADYGGLLNDVVLLLETARRTSARAVNAI